MTLSSRPVEAQTSPQPPGGSGADGRAWADAARCDAAGDADEKAAVAAARALFESAWLAAKGGYFMGYTLPGEQRNPFDLGTRTPAAGPRNGVVQARGMRCLVRQGEPHNPVAVRFVAALYRFYEPGAGWAPPMREGVAMDVAVVPSGAGWSARDMPSEATILEAGVKVTRPLETALPPLTRWPEPLPGCARGTQWNGSDCVKRRRKR